MTEAPHIRRGEINRQRKRLTSEGFKLLASAETIAKAISDLKNHLDQAYDVIERLECSCGFPVPSKQDFRHLVSIEIVRVLQANATLFALSSAEVDAAIAGKAPSLSSAAASLVVKLQDDFGKLTDAEEDAIRRAITGELRTYR
jgi:hypothetical protein